MPERPVVMDERVALQEPDGSLTFKTKKAKEGTIYKAGDQGIMIEKGVISLFEIEEPSEPCIMKLDECECETCECVTVAYCRSEYGYCPCCVIKGCKR